jgi:hypothetical protein
MYENRLQLVFSFSTQWRLAKMIAWRPRRASCVRARRTWQAEQLRRTARRTFGQWCIGLPLGGAAHRGQQRTVSMGVGPNHVVGAASWHAQAAWGLWLASMLMFLIYAFTTISSAIDMRDDPPHSDDVQPRDD